MKRPILLTIVLILLAASAYAVYRFSQAQPDRVEQAAASLGLGPGGRLSQPSSLQASGIVEAHSVLVASELGVASTSLAVAEGDLVVAGQPLLAVDDSLLQARTTQADAAVVAAEAQLALVQAGARTEALAHAQAQLAQAEIAAEVAKQAWDDAKTLRERPDDLDLKRIEAETALAVAEHEAKAARGEAQACRPSERALGSSNPTAGGGVRRLAPLWQLSRRQTRRTRSSEHPMECLRTASLGGMADCLCSRRWDCRRVHYPGRPPPPTWQFDRSGCASQPGRSSLPARPASIDQARAAVQGLEEGATAEEIEVARQAVEQARSGRAALRRNIARRWSVRRWMA